MADRTVQDNQSVNFARQTLAIYWQHTKARPLRFVIALIFIPLSSLMFATIVPYLLSQAVAGLAGNNIDIRQKLILAIVAGIAGGVCNYIGFVTIIKHESYMYNSLTNHAASKLIYKDVAFFSNQKIGALTGKYIEFVNSYIKIQDVLIIKTLSFAVAMGVGLVLIARASILLAALLFVFTIFILAEIRITMKLRTPYRKKRRESRADIMGEVADSLTNSLIVKTFAKEDRELDHIKDRTEEHAKLYIKDIGIVMREGTLRNIVTVGFQVGVVGVAIILLRNGNIELSSVIFSLTYLQRVAAQIFTLGDIVNGYDNAFLEAAPITKMILSDNQINDCKGAKNLRINKGKIRFINAGFSYEDGKVAISDLSLTIRPGEKIGLIGHSGAGKTTITKLLLRFDDLTVGRISIDGQDITDVTQQSLRNAIAYVPQEPMLFHRSLAENIGYAHDPISRKKIVAAAQKAHAHEFIVGLPNGYDTVVGERGVKLSGGQRQRVAIARAILKDAPILVLDEATSALDSVSEKLIQNALKKLMKGRTSIVIAHRLSTIQKMDRIIVLDNGKIVEEGTHYQLLKNKGTYAKLWAHQSGGFLED